MPNCLRFTLKVYFEKFLVLLLYRCKCFRLKMQSYRTTYVTTSYIAAKQAEHLTTIYSVVTESVAKLRNIKIFIRYCSDRGVRTINVQLVSYLI